MDRFGGSMSHDPTTEQRLIRIAERVETMIDRVDSLERAVKGAEVEGNLGIIARMDQATAQTTAIHLDFDRRIAAVERAAATMRAWAAGAAFTGGVLGGATTLAVQLLGWIA